MPAVYDLANRGLLPPGFALVGFARRDWADQDFAQIVHDAVKQHARTPFREEVWNQLAEGFRFVPGDFDDDDAFDHLAETSCAASTPSAAPAATTPSTCRSRRAFFPVVCEQLARSGLAAARARRPGAGSSSRSRSATTWRQRAELNDVVVRGLPARLGLPDRPLPRQGDGPEHPGAALRQPAVRADLERQLRRPRADHHGRGHRHRRPGRLLRRHRRRPRRDPEPPAAAARADRDGGAGLVRRRRTCAPRRRRCCPPSGCPTDLGATTARGQYAAGWQGGQKVIGYLEEDGIAGSSTTETYAAIKLEIDTRRWAGVPFYLRTGKRLGRRVTEIAVVFKRAPHLPFETTATEELGQNALVIRVQPDEGVTMRFGSKVPGTAMEVRDVTMDFGYGARVHRVLPRGLRAADPRRPARRAAAVPAARGGRAVLEDPRPDRGVLGQARPARAVPGRRLGTAGRRRDDGPRRPGLEAAVIIDLPSTTTARGQPQAGRPARLRRRHRPGPGADPGHRHRRGRGRGRHRGGQRRQPRAPLPGHRHRARATGAAPTGWTPRSGSAATPAPSEVIVLRLYGQLAAHADSVVTPLLLPDAPVVVWWPGQAPEGAVEGPARPDGPAPDHRRRRRRATRARS